MKLIIRGDEYDLFKSITDATLDELVELRRATEQLGEPVTPRVIREYLSDVVFKQTAAFAHVDDERSILCFRGLVFLAQRTAGKEIQFADTGATRLSDVQIQLDDKDTKPDPKAETGSGQDDEADTTT